MARQDRSAGSNRHKLEPSSNSKHRADTKTGTSPGVNIDRLSPYVRLTARRGSKRTADGIGRSSPVTARVSSGASLILPKTEDRTPERVPTFATTFVDSVISLCRRSIASCNVMSEPVPREDMFLFLVPLCGIAEAKYWAETMGVEYKKSHTLISALLYGSRDQFSQLPDARSNVSGHSGGHAQG